MAAAPHLSLFGVIAHFHLHVPKSGKCKESLENASFIGRDPDSLGVVFIIVSAYLLFGAHLPEAFMDDQLKPLVLPELLMDGVTEGIFCYEHQLTTKGVKVKVSGQQFYQKVF